MSTNNEKKNGSCLLTGLAIFAGFICLPCIIAFGWIIGIVWLILFRKKMSDEKNRKICTIVVSIATIISFPIFVCAMVSPKDSNQIEDATTVIEQTSEVETQTETAIETEETMVEATSSESETETVVDEIINQTDQESSKLEKIETDTTTDEKESISISDSKVTTNDTNVTSKDTSENTGITQNSETDNENQSSIQNSNESGSATVHVPEAETSGNLVWVPTNGGKKYHSRQGCSNMKDPIQVTKETAEANGYTPCGRCY